MNRLAMLAFVAFWINGVDVQGALMLASSEPVAMIDGNSDNDSTVTVGVASWVPGYDFGYVDATGSYVTLLSGGGLTSNTFVFGGGDIVDFAIRDSSGGIDALSGGGAVLTFFGTVPAANSQNPVVNFDYWKSLTILWTTAIGGQIAVNLGGQYDGMAPASMLSHSPEPSTFAVWMIGLTCGGFACWRKKRRTRSIHATSFGCSEGVRASCG